MDQKRTPLYDRLIHHAESDPVSFHVPGHKYGEVFPEKAKRYFREMLKLDATELTGLDDLHSPEGAILEAEELLGSLYSSRKSYFLVNGSTVGNLAMILATLGEDDVVLVQRNSHKSIMNGIRMAKAHPVFLRPEIGEDGKIAGGVSLETVKAAIEAFPAAKALILTYPNYFGMVYELGAIIEAAHSRNIPVLVDEAHGVHFIAGEFFPTSAVALGADAIVQSAHKTLPAMTMGAFLHINSTRLSLEKVGEYLATLQSSSPSYPLMASLDLARSYLGTFKCKDRQALAGRITEFRDKIGSMPNLDVLPVNGGDPLKLTIKLAGGQTGYDFQRLLEEEGLYSELADPYHVLLVLPLLKQGMSDRLDEAAGKIKAAALKLVPAICGPDFPLFVQKPFSTMAAGFHEISKMDEVKVPLAEAAGQICAEMIIPYPPGVPLCMPGVRIRQEEVEQLLFLVSHGAKIQGGSLLQEGLLKIIK
ncbi:aminotransferase class I/II-fold pyridoxal phosphate-dependent enzyme [Mesobacillus zeae]|uniref:Aminotransferase class I/II-fold pyridoxal phosphate-dependent enzyme n=1 Tax=Mesobacillus zeae TaxID=1917180 RepID=A0A398BMN3_9BACI|nr:aminotransferase class I/II-fold pyridoxal phosphate-dependent enzyme [Mesobacillus zeae]RID88623.1 aminotransferase class I/II-fold pyridoxal phosphate-dependent enzyme [Mesobacillus zeae]